MTAAEVTFGTLKTDVQQALDRFDAETISLIPTWVRYAQSEIYAVLRVPWMIRTGTAIFSQEVDSLPDSWLGGVSATLLAVDPQLQDTTVLAGGTGTVIGEEPALVLLAGGLPRGSFTQTMSRHLTLVGPERFAEFDRLGEPEVWIVEGHNVRFLPWPNKPVAVRLHYYSTGRVLSEDADKNELLFHVPNALFYGTLRHASSHYGRDQDAARFSAMMEAAISAANAQARGWSGPGQVMRFRVVDGRDKVRVGAAVQ